MDTADQKVAEHLAGAAEGRIFRLQQEKDELLRAPARIAEIDEELAILQAETVRLASRRPPRDIPAPPVDAARADKVGSKNVNPTRA